MHLIIEFSVLEANLGYFVKLDKGDFEGKEALVAQKPNLKTRMVLLELESTDVDAIHMEPVYSGDKIVGQISSGGYGHRTQKSLALAYMDIDALDASSPLSVKVLGNTYSATVTSGCVYDPKSAKLRSDS